MTNEKRPVGWPAKTISDVQRAQVADMITLYKTNTQIGAYLGVSGATVTRLLEREGLAELRQAFRARWQSNRGVAITHKAILRAGAAMGKPLIALGAETGVTRQRVWQVFKQFGCNEQRKQVRQRVIVAQRVQREWAQRRVAPYEEELCLVLEGLGFTVQIVFETKAKHFENSLWFHRVVFRLGTFRVKVHVLSDCQANNHIARHYFRTMTRQPDEMTLLVCADGQRGVFFPPHQQSQFMIRKLISPLPQRQRRRRAPDLLWQGEPKTAVSEAFLERVTHAAWVALGLSPKTKTT